MSLFFRKTSDQDQTFVLFTKWLDCILKKDLHKDIKTFNFNIYEGTKNTYDIELIGSDEYFEEDYDWACSDYFTTNNNLFFIKRKENIINWEDGLKYVIELVKRYLINGKYANILKDTLAVSVGFVNGDLEIVYSNN